MRNLKDVAGGVGKLKPNENSDKRKSPMDTIELILHHGLLLAVLANLTILVLETLDGPNHAGQYPRYPSLPTKELYVLLDAILTAIFTITFVGRIIITWTQGNLRVLRTDVLNWCDFLAILPFYVEYFLSKERLDGMDLTWLKLFRTMRGITTLRTYHAMKILSRALFKSTSALAITLFFLSAIALVFASAIFFAEPCEEPDCTFQDIMNAGYFLVVTFTSVGFGDQVPSFSNPVSILITVIAAIGGSLYLAMPLAIIGKNYQDAWDEIEYEEKQLRHASMETRESQLLLSVAGDDAIVTDMNYFLVNDDYFSLSGSLDKLVYFMSLAPTKNGSDEKGDQNKNINDAEHGQLLIKWKNTHRLKLNYFVNECLEVTEQLRSAADSIKRLLEKEAIRFQAMSKHPDSPGNLKTRKGGEWSKDVVSAAEASTKWKDRMWLLLNIPESSRQAHWMYVTRFSVIIFSIALFILETVPQLHIYGPTSKLCQEAIEAGCIAITSKGTFNDSAPGCWVQNQGPFYGEPLSFHCSAANCFGVESNYGSEMWANCTEAFPPSSTKVCLKRQCRDHTTSIDGELFWPWLELGCGIFFTLEIIFVFLASKLTMRQFFTEVSNCIDLMCLIPFYLEIFETIQSGKIPSYAIVGGFSFFSFIRVFKVIRIFKLAKHFEGTPIVRATFIKIRTQLTIPLFLLFIACILAGGVFYEVEGGVGCFVGETCPGISQPDKFLTNQIEPNGTRVVVLPASSERTLTPDMFRTIWLALMTVTSVGYGRIYPQTLFGKCVGIVTMLFGACYSAMPLSLVGNQFIASYEDAKKSKVYERLKSNKTMKTINIESKSKLKLVHPKIITQCDNLCHSLHRIQKLLDDLDQFNSLCTAVSKGGMMMDVITDVQDQVHHCVDLWFVLGDHMRIYRSIGYKERVTLI